MGTIISKGGPLAFFGASGGKSTPCSLGTSPAPIIGVNPEQQTLMFHNPGTVLPTWPQPPLRPALRCGQPSPPWPGRFRSLLAERWSSWARCKLPGRVLRAP
jgi:hypothetical protein